MVDDRTPLGGIGQTIVGDAAARGRLSDSILDVADQIDAEKKIIEQRLELVFAGAARALAQGDVKTAAKMYDKIADVWRTLGFAGNADYWTERARELRNRARKHARKAAR